MSAIGVKPRIFTNYLIKIGSTDTYEAAISSCKMTPSQSIQTWKGGTPASVHSAVTAPVWVCDMKVAQDWETEGSLSQYLLEHAGETVPVEFSPLGSGPKFSAEIILAAPEIGGDIDAWGEATVQHGVNGQPVFAAGAVTPPA